MARGTQEQKQAAEIGADFPYRTLMSHPAWALIDAALKDLEGNDDLELRTARRYIIGYLVQQLVEGGLIPPALVFRPEVSSEAQPRYRWILQVERSVSPVSASAGTRRKSG